MTDRPSPLAAAAAAVVLLAVSVHAQQPTASPDPSAAAAAQQVLAIFHAKCASCHDAAQGKGDGGLDYVMDLARLAGNRDLVVPFEVNQSELWFILDFDDMPPADSDVEPLTDAEKQAVRQWIQQGAVAVPWSGRTEQVKKRVAENGPRMGRDRPDGRELPRWLQWVGKLHPASVHVPIAMTLAALLAEVLFMATGRPSLRAVVGFSLWLGAAGALLATGLGWLHAESGVFAGQRQTALQWHRWLGVLATIWLIVAGVFDLLRHRRPQARWACWLARAALVMAVAIMAATGFLGGGLTHGLDHYRW